MTTSTLTDLRWPDAKTIAARHYTCGYCGASVAPDTGLTGTYNSTPYGWVFICHHCTRPTYIDVAGTQSPSPVFGKPVTNIPDKTVGALYEEARRATGAQSYTATVLCCRKLLMHIAVSKGADTNKNFLYYVEYLAAQHYIPPDAKGWVDYIRTKGNEATHEIVIMQKEEAERLQRFAKCFYGLSLNFQQPFSRQLLRHSPDRATGRNPFRVLTT